MTFKEKMIELLFDNGLFKEEAETVVARAIEQDTVSSFSNRWDDSIEDYPPITVNLLWASVKQVALEWIEETCPQAWFKPLFEEKKMNNKK